MKNQQIIRVANGEIDEAVIDGDTFHMERMAINSWWIGIWRGGKRTAFMLTSDKPITATLADDDIHCREVVE